MCTLLVALLSLALTLLTATPASAQPPRDAGRPAAGVPESLIKEKDYPIQLEPPGPDRIFHVESEAALRERIRQEFRQRNERAEFPPEIELVRAGTSYEPRFFPPMASLFVPDAVCYKPLYFEDKNVERYGWDTGIFQPALSTAKFYVDLAMLPYNMGVMHPCACEFNNGYIKSGDPAAFFLYIPPFSLKGAALQAGVIAGGIAIWP